MSIQSLKKLQKDWEDNIVSTANEIDPKLIGLLFYEDIFNDHYCNDKFKQLYLDKIHPLFVQYSQEFKLAEVEYIINFINDMSLILPSTGYLSSTGELTYDFKYAIDSDYIPCVEIEPIYEAVTSMIYDVQVQPFWTKHSYVLFGNNESIQVVADSTPSGFINANRNKFKRSFGETNIQKMERAVKIKDSFDYPIIIPALSKFEDTRIPDSYETAVRRHAILKKVMETEGVLVDSSSFVSSLDMDGNVSLRDRNNRIY
jgi:hypothetical protein